MNTIGYRAIESQSAPTAQAPDGTKPFGSMSKVGMFLDSVATELAQASQGLIGRNDEPAQFSSAGATTGTTLLVKMQMAFRLGAYDYGKPHSNSRFAAGLDPQQVYDQVTGMAMPQGLQTQWDDYAALRAQRPDPETYLDPAYINEHLSQFDSGAVSFITREQFLRFTVDGNQAEYHGRPEGLFVLPANWAASMINEQASDPAIASCADKKEKNFELLKKVEIKMGIPAGLWSKPNSLLAIVIERPRDLNLRMVTGREGGANLEWRPGGYTIGGTPEAMVDRAQIHKGIAVPFDRLHEVLGDRANMSGGMI